MSGGEAAGGDSRKSNRLKANWVACGPRTCSLLSTGVCNMSIHELIQDMNALYMVTSGTALANFEFPPCRRTKNRDTGSLETAETDC